MTRATLLSLLAHPAALTGPDIRVLEGLARAFPYCQTAHLLLAKAAHDQDSMLAAQRLRHAATYATDRARLRYLIELPAPATALAATGSGALNDEEQDIEDEGAIGLQDRLSPMLLPWSLLPAPPSGTAPAEPPVAVVAAPAAPTAVVAAPTAPAADEPASAAPLVPVVSVAAEVETLAAEMATEVEAPAAEVPAPTTAPELAPLAEPEAPAQAPPIRPPAEAGAARFEFGLAADEPADLLPYRLLVPEPDAPGQAASIPLPFSGVPGVRYALGEGSRLGFCLLAPEQVAAQATTALPGTALPTAEFFEPDALLLEHLATPWPVEPERGPGLETGPEAGRPSSGELINSFLQRAPLASRRRAMPSPAMPDPAANLDLSLASTRAEPDLVSENLARILVRQGKNERAIAVYERLIVKYPAKMAYFAAQIDSLRPSA